MPNFDLNYIKTNAKKRILGVAFPMMNEGIGGYVAQNENLKSLKDCVIQLIMTGRGARVMRPDYGTDLRASVFEQMTGDMIDALKQQILQTISKYEPRVIVKRIALTPNFERHTLKVELYITSKDDLLNGELVEVLV
jgi:phage baseplate assembly protein W